MAKSLDFGRNRHSQSGTSRLAQPRGSRQSFVAVSHFEFPEDKEFLSKEKAPQEKSRYKSLHSVLEQRSTRSSTCRSAPIPQYTSIFEQIQEDKSDARADAHLLDQKPTTVYASASTVIDSSASTVMTDYKYQQRHKAYNVIKAVIPATQRCLAFGRVRPKKTQAGKQLRRDPLVDTLQDKIYREFGQNPSLDTGYDWRFLSATEYLEMRNMALSQRRWDVLRRLRECVQSGTAQALSTGKYPVPSVRLLGWDQSLQEIAWVDLSKYRHSVLRLMWYSPQNLYLDGRSSMEPVHQEDDKKHEGGLEDDEESIEDDAPASSEPPVICTSMSPLDTALAVGAELGESPEKAPVCLVIDLEFPLQNAPTDNNPGVINPGVETFQEALFHRTDVGAVVTEAEDRIKHSQSIDSSSLKEHLCAVKDPFVIHCEGVVTFRAGADQGYSFLKEPYVIDGTILMAMDTQYPLVAGTVKVKEEYANEAQGKSLISRLQLVCHAALTSHDCPVLVLSLPGLLDRRRHPFYAVALALRSLRLQFARQFRAVVIACGSEEAALKVDYIVNNELFTPITGILKAAWRAPATHPVFDQLTKLSANPAWKGGQPIACAVPKELKERYDIDRALLGQLSLKEIIEGALGREKKERKGSISAENGLKNQMACVVNISEANGLEKVIEEEEKVKDRKTVDKSLETQTKSLARCFIDAGISLRRKRLAQHRANAKLPAAMGVYKVKDQELFSNSVNFANMSTATCSTMASPSKDSAPGFYGGSALMTTENPLLFEPP